MNKRKFGATLKFEHKEGCYGECIWVLKNKQRVLTHFNSKVDKTTPSLVNFFVYFKIGIVLS